MLDTEVVSGNAVRTRHLKQALEKAGHDNAQVWTASEDDRRDGAFRTRDELQGLISRAAPAVIIVSYWELVALLPYQLKARIVLDFVAPRPLEQLFEAPDRVRDEFPRLRAALERCDRIMVGNARQGDLLINTLIECGFDLRDETPLLTLPLSAPASEGPVSNPGDDGWVLVAGGVNWPWRNALPFHRQIHSFLQGREDARLVEFGGEYRWAHANGEPLSQVTEEAESRDLRSYREYQQYLNECAHIGVELAESNVERSFSQSFRSLDFLRHGLPLLCNSYLPLASRVREYDAGWLLDQPEALPDLLASILGDVPEWKRKSDNALRLARDQLDPDANAQPLLTWLQTAAPAARLPSAPRDAAVPPVIAVPRWGKRVRRLFSLAARSLTARLFARPGGSGVIIVTRSDLFPSDHGAAVRTVETARALASKGINVGIVTDRRGEWFEFTGGEVRTRRVPWWARLMSGPAALSKARHYSKDIPLSNGFLYLPLSDRSFRWRILAAARVIGPAILQAEFPAYAEPCLAVRDALGCRVVLVEHNVEYERLKDQLRDLTAEQYERFRSIELDLCNRSDATVCVSDNDRQKLSDDGVDTRLLHTIPHGVDLSSYENTDVVEVHQQFGIPNDALILIYHGTFSYPPNREALGVFADTLLPGLEKRGIDAHVLAVGRNPPARSGHERIHLTGSVENVAAWLKAAHLSVIPLIDGGGTRMKIIDCFAASLPVISTAKGIEGIAVVPGAHASVVNEWEEMLDEIERLWRDESARKNLGRAGRDLAGEMDWSSVADRYSALYAGLT